MIDEINQLAAKISALTDINRRLASQNNHLKGELAESERQLELSLQRLDHVRGKVENALSRLPVLSDN
jgi:type II secretory pathway component PulM